MTETPTPTPTTETTTPAVAPQNVKPYDDEMLNAYSEAAEQEAATADKGTEKEEAADKPAQEEEASSEEKAEPAKAKVGDKVEDGFEEVPIKKVLNGKEVEFKVKDAIKAYLSQEEFNRNMDRRLSSVSQREKAWESEVTSFNGQVKNMLKAAQSGNFVDAVRALAKVAVTGTELDPVEFEKSYFDQLEKVREVYTKLTPEQREAYFAKRALAEAKAKASELERDKAQMTERSNLGQKVFSLQKEHGIPQEEFWGNYKAMEELLVGEGKPYSKPDDISPEDVVKYSLRVRHEEKVLSAAKQVGIEDDAILNEVSRITLSDPSLTVEEISKIIKDAGLVNKASPQAVENLNRKAEKNKTRFSQASSTKEEKKLEGYDEESLNFLYRNQPKVYHRPAR